jgi:Flp pilus assembly protein TadD
MRAAAANIAGKRDTPQKKALAYQDLSRLLLKSGQPEEALGAVRQSLQYNPTDERTRMLLSEIESTLATDP